PSSSAATTIGSVCGRCQSDVSLPAPSASEGYTPRWRLGLVVRCVFFLAFCQPADLQYPSETWSTPPIRHLNPRKRSHANAHRRRGHTLHSGRLHLAKRARPRAQEELC